MAFSIFATSSPNLATLVAPRRAQVLLPCTARATRPYHCSTRRRQNTLCRARSFIPPGPASVAIICRLSRSSYPPRPVPESWSNYCAHLGRHCPRRLAESCLSETFHSMISPQMQISRAQAIASCSRSSKLNMSRYAGRCGERSITCGIFAHISPPLPS
ncbi:hypothetical protein CPB85DRAFT_257989 [Mucidula mucida]|nr:hypothetical protein CPB85DRAFT_257989 [Mucidula mucida]